MLTWLKSHLTGGGLTAFISHSDCLQHNMGSGHPECPERLVAIKDQLMAADLLVVNKAEGMRHHADLAQFHELGLGEPHPISAAHGDGVSALADEALAPLLAEQARLKVREAELEEAWMEALELLESMQAELEALS